MSQIIAKKAQLHIQIAIKVELKRLLLQGETFYKDVRLFLNVCKHVCAKVCSELVPHYIRLEQQPVEL